MHDFPRQKLRELITRHGTFLSEDAKRCESLLRDACGGEYKREVFVLIHAIKENVPNDLLNLPRGLSLDEVFVRLVQRLHDNLGLDKTLAEWVVQSWGMALGLKVTTSVIEGNATEPLVNQSVTKSQPLWLSVVSQPKRHGRQSTTKSQPAKAKVTSQPKRSITQSTTAKVTSQPKRLVSEPVTTSQPHSPAPPKRLSPFNPFDHLRLLWWVLVMPQQLQAYRQVFSDADEKRVGKWLVSTLTWWPLLIPTLASGLGLLPHSGKVPLEVYLGLSALLVVCWLLTGGVKITKGASVAIGVAISVAFGVAIGVAFVVANVVGNVVAFGVAFVVAGIVALIVADTVADGVESGVALVVMSGVVGGVAGSVAGGVMGLISGGEALVVAVIILGVVGDAIESSLDTGTPSWLARFALLQLVAAHLFLIGLYFFEWFNI